MKLLMRQREKVRQNNAKDSSGNLQRKIQEMDGEEVTTDLIPQLPSPFNSPRTYVFWT